MSFAKNFALAFLGFFALALVVTAIAIGPIVLMMHLNVAPLPYGLPIVLSIYCALGALIAAMQEREQK